MGLYYKSTRNSNLKVTASEAILKDVSGDCISRYETVLDRLYRRRTEELYQ